MAERITMEQMTCLLIGGVYMKLKEDGPLPLSQMDDEAIALAERYGFTRQDAMRALHSILSEQNEMVALNDGYISLTPNGVKFIEAIYRAATDAPPASQ